MLDVGRVYQYIDDHIDAHTAKIQSLLRQPSSSKTDPEGTRQCAELIREQFLDLGCRHVELFESGLITYVGWPGYPVVYGEYDAGAEKTLIVYMMYDTQPFQEDEWISHPLEANLVDMDPFGKCLVARGATNQKGPLRAFLNAVEAIKATGQRLPVNLKFIAEGEEELMSPSLPAFIEEYRPRLEADAVFFPSFSQGKDGDVSMSLGNKGSFGFVLECRGGGWGGPARSDIHSANQAWVDNPAWRLVEALSTMYDAKNHRVLIDGWYDDVEPPSEEDKELLARLADTFDEEEAKERLGVKRFVGDLHGKDLLVQYLYSTELIIFHIHAGSPVASSQRVLGIVPHKANMRMNGRLVPDQKIEKVLPMIQDHLAGHGYSDLEIIGFGGYPWSKVSVREPIVQATIDTYREFGFEPEVWPHSVGSAPNYLFTGKDYLNVPNLAGGLGHGGNVHAPNEYLVVEGKGRIQGLAACEKWFVRFLNRFAQDHT
jgi:acetylornithine deacetylase/succinyl-diaminopimelate desuccinylase-like protein